MSEKGITADIRDVVDVYKQITTGNKGIRFLRASCLWPVRIDLFDAIKQLVEPFGLVVYWEESPDDFRMALRYERRPD